MLKALLTIALGFGITAQAAFYPHIAFNAHHRFIPLVLAVALAAIAYQYALKNAFKQMPRTEKSWIGLTILGALAFLLWMEAKHYPLGGWDAWSCWNLKAKFIYLGEDNWKDMLDPVLWRSNTQYPLLLPLINVWFWNILGNDFSWLPMLNSILFTVLSAGILFFALQHFTKNWLIPAVLTCAVFLVPFNVTLSISQYSDILIGLYLLCAFVCLLSKEMLLCGLFTGLLSFTKSEGLVLSGVLTLLVLLRYKTQAKPFLAALILAALPTVIFQFGLAPKNEAFINGLSSITNPSTFERLQVIFAYTGLELISPKWNGLWLLVIAGLGLGWKKAFHKDHLLIGITILAYLGIVLGYYYLNTFFEIIWWMQNTLNRILFAVLPCIVLWLGLTFKTKN